MSIQLQGFGSLRQQMTVAAGGVSDSISILNNSTLRRKLTHIGASFRPAGDITVVGNAGWSWRVVVGVAPRFNFLPYTGGSGGAFGLATGIEALAISVLGTTAGIVSPAVPATSLFQRILFDRMLTLGVAAVTGTGGGNSFFDVDFAQTPDLFDIDEGETVLMIATNPARSQGDTFNQPAFCEISLYGIEEGGASNVPARQ